MNILSEQLKYTHYILAIANQTIDELYYLSNLISKSELEFIINKINFDYCMEEIFEKTDKNNKDVPCFNNLTRFIDCYRSYKLLSDMSTFKINIICVGLNPTNVAIPKIINFLGYIDLVDKNFTDTSFTELINKACYKTPNVIVYTELLGK